MLLVCGEVLVSATSLLGKEEVEHGVLAVGHFENPLSHFKFELELEGKQASLNEKGEIFASIGDTILLKWKKEKDFPIRAFKFESSYQKEKIESKQLSEWRASNGIVSFKLDEKYAIGSYFNLMVDSQIVSKENVERSFLSKKVNLKYEKNMHSAKLTLPKEAIFKSPLRIKWSFAKTCSSPLIVLYFKEDIDFVKPLSSYSPTKNEGEADITCPVPAASRRVVAVLKNGKTFCGFSENECRLFFPKGFDIAPYKGLREEFEKVLPPAEKEAVESDLFSSEELTPAPPALKKETDVVITIPASVEFPQKFEVEWEDKTNTIPFSSNLLHLVLFLEEDAMHKKMWAIVKVTSAKGKGSMQSMMPVGSGKFVVRVFLHIPNFFFFNLFFWKQVQMIQLSSAPPYKVFGVSDPFYIDLPDMYNTPQMHTSIEQQSKNAGFTYIPRKKEESKAEANAAPLEHPMKDFPEQEVLVEVNGGAASVDYGTQYTVKWEDKRPGVFNYFAEKYAVLIHLIEDGDSFRQPWGIVQVGEQKGSGTSYCPLPVGSGRFVAYFVKQASTTSPLQVIAHSKWFDVILKSPMDSPQMLEIIKKTSMQYNFPPLPKLGSIPKITKEEPAPASAEEEEPAGEEEPAKEEITPAKKVTPAKKAVPSKKMLPAKKGVPAKKGPAKKLAPAKGESAVSTGAASFGNGVTLGPNVSVGAGVKIGGSVSVGGGVFVGGASPTTSRKTFASWKEFLVEAGIKEDQVVCAYVKEFEKNSIELDQVVDIEREDLKELNISLGHRMRILKLVKKLRN